LIKGLSFFGSLIVFSLFAFYIGIGNHNIPNHRHQFRVTADKRQQGPPGSAEAVKLFRFHSLFVIGPAEIRELFFQFRDDRRIYRIVDAVLDFHVGTVEFLLPVTGDRHGHIAAYELRPVVVVAVGGVEEPGPVDRKSVV
jgi:hypothetical protein